MSEHAPLQRHGTWKVAAESCAADEGLMHPGRLHEPSFTVYAASKLSADESVQPGSRKPHPPESTVAEGSYPGRALSVQPRCWQLAGSATLASG